MLVEAEAAPEVFRKVLEAKRMLATGEARSVGEAARMCGLSRSAFYKYRDKVLPFTAPGGSVVTLRAVLRDEAGVLSRLTNRLYKQGANILTIHQSTPSSGLAPVTLTARVAGEGEELEELLRRLRTIEGVLSLEIN